MAVCKCCFGLRRVVLVGVGRLWKWEESPSILSGRDIQHVDRSATETPFWRCQPNPLHMAPCRQKLSSHHMAQYILRVIQEEENN